MSSIINKYFVNELTRIVLQSLFASGLTFIYTIIVARTINPEDYYLFGTAIAIINISYGLISPLHSITIIFFSKNKITSPQSQVIKGFHTIKRYSLLLSSILILILILSTHFFKNLTHIPQLSWYYIFITILFYAPVCINRGYFRGMLLHNLNSNNNTIESLSRFIFGGLFLLISNSIYSALIGYVIGIIIAFLHSNYHTPHINKSAQNNKTNLNRLLDGSLPIILLTISSPILQNSGGLIAQYHLTPIEASSFFVALSIARISLIVLQPFASYALPLFLDLHMNGKDTSRHLYKIIILFTLTSIPIILLGMLFPDLIIKLLFSNNYSNASDFLPILIPAYIFISISHILASAAVATSNMSVISTYLTGIILSIIIPNYFSSTAYQLSASILATTTTLAISLIIIFIKTGNNRNRTLITTGHNNEIE